MVVANLIFCSTLSLKNNLLAVVFLQTATIFGSFLLHLTKNRLKIWVDKLTKDKLLSF